MNSVTRNLQELQKKHKKLASEIMEIGFICPGTISWRYLTCGKDGCGCKSDQSKRHGPYPYWTTKRSRKTTSKKLTTNEAEILESWVENRKTINTILDEMKKISAEALSLELEIMRNISY